MAYVTLYTFFRPASYLGPDTLITVIRDDTDLTFTDFYTTPAIGGPTQPPEGTIISVVCQDTTKYTYKVKTNLSYVTYETEINSYYCGYTPPTCDIFEKSFSKTDETGIGTDDGAGNMFAVSSFSPITYYLYNSGGLITSNTIGLFTGLTPNDYFIKAIDTNECSILHDFTILAYDPSLTRCKYRMQFKSILGGVTYRLDFLDQKHQYDPATHPIYLDGTDVPLKKTTANPNEDKTEPILATTLDISVWHTGIIDVDNEFAKVDERTWFMQLYRNDVLDFQGWLLPDQIGDMYADPNYPLSFTATDGLASLKGFNFGDPTIFTYDVNMNKIYTQLYGLFGWSYLVKICLDWLNYDYGNTTLVSSLRNDDVYDEQFWSNISTWGDNYYDSSGNPDDVYTALSKLLKSVKLTICQVNGAFVLVNWNDLWYINKGLQIADYNLSFYTFNSDMSGVINTGANQPALMPIGAGRILKPINPMQTINYDLSFGVMKAQIDFNILALLYENPSFEIGAVQGDLPPGYDHKFGTVDAFANYDPVTETIGSGAYDGEWEIKVKPVSVSEGSSNFFENPSPFFDIDQSNKLLNISFVWKVPPNTNTLLGFAEGYVFSFTAVFIDASSGNGYFLKVNPSTSISYHDYLANGRHPPNQPSQTIWEHLEDTYYTEGDACGIKGIPTTDYIGWQSYSITAPIFPESQIGTVSVRFYSVKAQLYDTSKYTVLPGDPISFRQGFYIDVPDTDSGYYLIDQLNITLSDASSATNLQIGETHTVTNVTNFAKAETKQIDLSLFTYPPNKRLAGQLMYGLTYDTAITMNALRFKLQTTANKGRLPMAIIGSWARTYQRPMDIFEGDIKADNMLFYGIYTLDGYNGLFIPFSISADLRNSEVHVVIVAFDDSDAQVIYNYAAKYQKNSRENG